MDLPNYCSICPICQFWKIFCIHCGFLILNPFASFLFAPSFHDFTSLIYDVVPSIYDPIEESIIELVLANYSTQVLVWRAIQVPFQFILGVWIFHHWPWIIMTQKAIIHINKHVRSIFMAFFCAFYLHVHVRIGHVRFVTHFLIHWMLTQLIFFFPTTKSYVYM